MKLLNELLPGARLGQFPRFEDQRGDLVKLFHRHWFEKNEMPFEPREEFYSTSGKDVLRGMHFQVPPADHAKLVTCLSGKVLDVILDLRKDSDSYGQFSSAELSDENRHFLFIPSGFAHGFLSLSEASVLHYLTGTEHSPEHDRGVRWDSFDFDWPVRNPLISKRDLEHPALADFRSPF